MSIVVQKFGGTSVADATKIVVAARRAVATARAGYQVVMVVSARGKKTDELVGLAAEITDNPPPREMDMLLSTGEQESVALMAMAINELGAEAISLTGAQIGVVTDSSHTKARIQDISTERMRSALGAGKIVIAAGFQGVDSEFNITTLGRGGSDTTATALAAVLQADLCEIYTDVEGVFTTDPRLVSEARKIERISYDEMLELASVGAGVMHSRSIEFAKKYRVPLRVRPSFSDGEGTLIDADSDGATSAVSGVALVRNEARVSLCDIPDKPGVVSRIFAEMAARKIPVDMVVQNIGRDGVANVSFTVPTDDLAETLTAAESSIREIGAGTVQHGTHVAKVSAVGAGMRSHTGVAAKMFQSLSDASVNVDMVTTSEIKISVLVDRSDCDKAILAIHECFALDQTEPTAAAESPAVTAETARQRAREEVEQDVVSRLASMEDIVVSDVQLDMSQARITIENLPNQPGVARSVFSAVAEGNVMVDMIVQSSPVRGQASLSFTVPQSDLEKCTELLTNVVAPWTESRITFDESIARLSVMGIGLRSHTGVGDRMFRALADEQINIQMINTSEILMSAVIAADAGERALACLKKAFKL